LAPSVTSCSKILKRRVFTGGNRGNGGASRWFIHSSFKEFEVEPMSGSKIPPIGPLRYLLFKNLKEKSFYRRKQRKRRSIRAGSSTLHSRNLKLSQWPARRSLQLAHSVTSCSKILKRRVFTEGNKGNGGAR
jgi:hypothetical protein